MKRPATQRSSRQKTREAEPEGQDTSASPGLDAQQPPPDPPSALRPPHGRAAPAEPAETLSAGKPGSASRSRRSARPHAPRVDAGTAPPAADAHHDAPPQEPGLQELSAGQLEGGCGDILMEAVIKVFCVHTEPNFSLPWQRKRQYSSSSSGFVIPGRRILTNAHCVDHHTQVKVKRRGSDQKFVASVLAVGAECDIAMLTVADDTFWQDLTPVRFGKLPQLQEAVTVVGYPIGGDTMSVTSGVVSRIEVTSYVHGSAELLGVQIDAAINSGNSGGPAFNARGDCVGIAFQSLKNEDAENIGYIIPTPVIEHFTNDFERNGAYTGFPALGVEWQRLENPDLREALGMQAGQHGVMLRRLEPTAPVSKVLGRHDVILSFNGVEIADDGTVPFRSGERISFSYLVSNLYVGDTARLRVLQGGKERTVAVQLQAPTRLIPYHIGGRPPSYFIVAGLVFTPVTVPYLKSEYGKEFDFEAPVKLLEKMMHAQADAPDQQVVVLSQVLASDVNIGYEDVLNTQVVRLNGQPVHNLAGVVAAVDACTDPFLSFDLEYNQKLVLSTAKAKASTQQILDTHCIAADRSPDLPRPGTANGAAVAADSSGDGGGAAAAAVDGAGGQRTQRPAGRGRKPRAGNAVEQQAAPPLPAAAAREQRKRRRGQGGG